MRNLIILLSILISTTVMAQDGKVEVPKIGIKVSMGETVKIQDVSVKFIQVLEDSRCPKNTNCIWAGRVIAEVEVTSDGKKEIKNLIFGELRADENESKVVFSSKEVNIIGLDVTPYPDVTEKMDKSSYSLVITQNQQE